MIEIKGKNKTHIKEYGEIYAKAFLESHGTIRGREKML